MNKLILGTALCMSMGMAGCVGPTEEGVDDTSEQSDAITIGPSGHMNNAGAMTWSVARGLQTFVLETVTTALFNQLWGGIGTVVDDGEFRLDIQNPANGMQNLQIQRGGSTLATVLVSTALAHLDGNPNDQHAPAVHEMREFTNQLRAALLSSAWSVLKGHPTNYQLIGPYANAPRRRLLSQEPDTYGYAGPLLSQADANSICPIVAHGLGGVWTGQWDTVVWDQESVCDVNPEFYLDAGPIANNSDAQTKCPATCSKEGLRWTGNWNTVIWGKESVCACL